MKFFRFYLGKPWLPFVIVFVIAILFVVFFGIRVYSLNNENFDWIGIHTESMGMVLDILFLGIVWSIIDSYRSKRNLINRYKEEIDDFRFWSSEEASLRLAGIINRLVDLKVYDFNLNFCNLKFANLSRIKVFSDILSANFEGASLYSTEMKNIDLTMSTFENAKLNGACFNGSNLFFVEFKGADLTDADFRGCENIEHAYFWGSKFIWKAKFDEHVNLDELKKKKDFRYDMLEYNSFLENKEKIEILFNCTILDYKVKSNEGYVSIDFTKEYFVNWESLIFITNETENFYTGQLKLDDIITKILNLDVSKPIIK